MTDIVERLSRDLPPSMKEAVCPASLLQEAADEIVRLRLGIDAARHGLLRVERQAEETRATVTKFMRTINGMPDVAITAGSQEREYDANIAPCDDAEFGMKP